MTDFLFQPTPHQAAIDFIRSKPAVSAQVFDGLLPAIRARAITIAGVESAGIVQDIRDTLARLPAGADWKTLRSQIADDLHPFLANPEDPANRTAAERRAELLLRTHGFQAYQATNVAVMRRQADVLPYWQYLSMQDGRVRDTHRALEGKILPADHPFWLDHTPPWEWGCRCQIVPLSPEDVAEIQEADAHKAPEERRLLPPAVLDELTRTGRLVTGPNLITDLRSPSAKGLPGAFTWQPDTLTLPLDQLRARYDAAVWSTFQTWAQKTSIPSIRLTVWEWLNSQTVLPPTASTTLPPQQPHPTIDNILQTLGLHVKIQWDPSDVQSILTAMAKVGTPTADTIIADITGNDLQKSGVGSAAWVREQVGHIIKILPPEITATLPKPTVRIVKKDGSSFGSYHPGSHTITVARGTCLNSPGGVAQFHETLWHETMHWIHFHGPQSYRDTIATHFRDRTQGEELAPNTYGGYGRRDKWWDEYAGAQYINAPFDTPEGNGIEVPTRYFQLMAHPEKLIRQLDAMFNANAAHFLETLKVVLSVFQGEHK